MTIADRYQAELEKLADTTAAAARRAANNLDRLIGLVAGRSRPGGG